MAFELPALAYATDALEPHIDKMTMEIHHGKHHQAYVTNLNKALEGKPEANSSIDDIIKNISNAFSFEKKRLFINCCRGRRNIYKHLFQQLFILVLREQ